MMTSRCFLSHSDLDGAASYIIAREVWPIDEYVWAGYRGLQSKLKKLAKKHESLVVADLSFTLDDMILACKSFSEVIYVDHHPASEIFSNFMLPLFGPTTPTAFIAENKCSAKIMLDRYMETDGWGSRDLWLLAQLTDIYDRWLVKDRDWSKAYNLNALYWHYGFDDFVAKYDGGLPQHWEEDNGDLLHDLNSKKARLLKESVFRKMNNQCIRIECPNKMIVNDYALAWPEYKVYYILIFDDKRKYASLRLGVDVPFIDLQKDVAAFPDTRGIVSTSGGHGGAVGIQFKMTSKIDQVVAYLEDLNEHIRHNEIDTQRQA